MILSLPCTAQNKGSTRRIILIRHAEKPADGDNLSCSGFDRSLKLAQVLSNKFGVPDEVYVSSPNTGKQTKSVRMLQTALPLATKYNLTINSSYDAKDVKKLSNTIRKSEGTILVVWQHSELPALARSLGIKTAGLSWNAEDYDSIWLITYKDGKAILKKDKEGIIPAGGCPF